MNPEKRKLTLIARYGSWEAYKLHQAKHGRKGGQATSGYEFAHGKVNPAEAGEKGRRVRDGKKQSN